MVYLVEYFELHEFRSVTNIENTFTADLFRSTFVVLSKPPSPEKISNFPTRIYFIYNTYIFSAYDYYDFKLFNRCNALYIDGTHDSRIYIICGYRYGTIVLQKFSAMLRAYSNVITLAENIIVFPHSNYYVRTLSV